MPIMLPSEPEGRLLRERVVIYILLAITTGLILIGSFLLFSFAGIFRHTGIPVYLLIPVLFLVLVLLFGNYVIFRRSITRLRYLLLISSIILFTPVVIITPMLFVQVPPAIESYKSTTENIQLVEVAITKAGYKILSPASLNDLQNLEGTWKDPGEGTVYLLGKIDGSFYWKVKEIYGQTDENPREALSLQKMGNHKWIQIADQDTYIVLTDQGPVLLYDFGLGPDFFVFQFLTRLDQSNL